MTDLPDPAAPAVVPAPRDRQLVLMLSGSVLLGGAVFILFARMRAAQRLAEARAAAASYTAGPGPVAPTFDEQSWQTSLEHLAANFDLRLQSLASELVSVRALVGTQPAVQPTGIPVAAAPSPAPGGAAFSGQPDAPAAVSVATHPAPTPADLVPAVPPAAVSL